MIKERIIKMQIDVKGLVNILPDINISGKTTGIKIVKSNAEPPLTDEVLMFQPDISQEDLNFVAAITQIDEDDVGIFTREEMDAAVTAEIERLRDVRTAVIFRREG